MHFLALVQTKFVRIYNGVLSTLSAMNFTPDQAPDRIVRTLPDLLSQAAHLPCDGRVPAVTRLVHHASAFGAVLALHLAAAWAVHLGLRTPADELLVPVQMLAELVEVQAPIAQPTPDPAPPSPLPPRPAPAAAKPQPRPVIARPAPQPAPAPAATLTPTVLPTAAAEPSPLQADTPAAPMNNVISSVAAPAAADPAPSAVAVTPSAPLPLELPSSDAQYLQNPKPRYPPISLRMGEQGTVLVRVLVTDTGLAKDVQIKSSSGFFRLDNAALEAVTHWRFVPGKRGGVPGTMWFTVPITFGLR